jgi:hypothetical protein
MRSKTEGRVRVQTQDNGGEGAGFCSDEPIREPKGFWLAQPPSNVAGWWLPRPRWGTTLFRKWPNPTRRWVVGCGAMPLEFNVINRELRLFYLVTFYKKNLKIFM